MEEGISTKIDKLIKLIERRKSVSIPEAAKLLKEGEETIEMWGKILHDHGIVELIYPSSPLRKPFLRRVKR
jgi:hypothetical protein